MSAQQPPVPDVGSMGAGRRPPLLMLAVVALFVTQCLVAIAVVPPWQNPDEPQHLMTTRLVVTHGSNFDLERDLDRESERTIIASMARHGWWRHYRMATPDPLPETFEDGPAKVVGQYFGPLGGGSRMFYSAIATVVRVGAIDDVIAQLYLMRVVSVLAGALTLWCVWSGTRRVAGDQGAAVVATILALHPQFVLVSTSASPDAFVNLAGALVWRQIAVLVSSDVALADVAWLWVGAIGAFMLRRLGAPLVALAAVMTVIVGWRALRGKRRWRPVVFAAGLAAVLAVVLLAAVSDFARALEFIRFDPAQSLATSVSRAEQLPAFFDMMYRTFWLAAGWLRYQGPWWWHAVTVCLCAVASIGVVGPVLRLRASVMVAAAAVAIQVIPVVAYHFGILESGPQGRYLFPVLAPLLFLLWVGWRNVLTRFVPVPVAAMSLVTLAALLNVSAWGAVVLPAFT